MEVTEVMEICGTPHGIAATARAAAPYEDGWRLVSDGCADGECVVTFSRPREVSAGWAVMEVSDE